MGNVPTPPATLWDKYPEVGIIILIALVLVGLFVAYNERRDKINRDYNSERERQWQAFLVEQRNAYSDKLGELANTMRQLTDAITELRSDFHAHDEMERQALLNSQPNPTKPRRKLGSD